MMARFFSFEGDHAGVTLYGVTFPQGEPVPVESAFLQKKLEGNRDFKEHGAAPDVVSVEAKYTIKHQGRGKWSVLDASGEVVASGLTKDEAQVKASQGA